MTKVELIDEFLQDLEAISRLTPSSVLGKAYKKYVAMRHEEDMKESKPQSAAKEEM